MVSSAKAFNKVLLTRLRTPMECILLACHAGFREYRCTVEQILTLRVCIDACRTRKRDIWIIFIDFSKAFDCIDRSALRDILTFYGIEECFVNAIMSLYTGTNAYVRTSQGNSDTFETTSGVLQGDTLAPYLFVTVMDYILRTSLLQEDGYTVRRRMSSRKEAVRMPVLAYADDVAILCDTAAAAQRQLARLERAANSIGLKLNFKKSKVMHVGDQCDTDIITLSGNILPTCNSFCYLGSEVSDSRAGLQKRKHLAWLAARKLSVVWGSSASTEAKSSLFVSCIESSLLYSGESWTLTNTLSEELDASHRSLLRFALGIRYPDKISNSALYHTSGVPPATTTLRRKRLALLGHVTRRPNVPLAIVLHPHNQASEPYRRGGALRRTFKTLLDADIQSIGLDALTYERIAQDRKRWATLVRGTKS